MYEYMDRHQKVMYIRRLANRWLAIQLEILTAIIIFIVALFVVYNRDNLSPALVGLSLTYSLKSTLIISCVVRTMSDVEADLVSIERFDEYMQEKEEAPLMLNDKVYQHNIDYK